MLIGFGGRYGNSGRCGLFCAACFYAADDAGGYYGARLLLRQNG